MGHLWRAEYLFLPVSQENIHRLIKFHYQMIITSPLIICLFFEEHVWEIPPHPRDTKDTQDIREEANGMDGEQEDEGSVTRLIRECGVCDDDKRLGVNMEMGLRNLLLFLGGWL